MVSNILIIIHPILAQNPPENAFIEGKNRLLWDSVIILEHVFWRTDERSKDCGPRTAANQIGAKNPLLVCLRAFQESAVLRRFAQRQRDRNHSGQIRDRIGKGCMAVHVQAHRQSAVLRWNA